MGLVLALDVLQDVSLVLVEPVVRTTLTGAVAAPGPVTVGAGSVAGLYVGAILLVGRETPNVEVVIVTAVGTNSFSALFANIHQVGESVNGATFPSGQPDAPLFTIQEMLGYLFDVENDFLLRTRCIYAVQKNIDLVNNERFYARPTDAVRIERIVTSDGVSEVKNTSQETQDMLDSGWESEGTSDLRQLRWFEDGIGGDRFGINPLSNVGGSVDVWYSQKDTAIAGIADTLSIPDVCSYALKYGVLARAFAKDGEQRDDFRSKYCEKRFDMTAKLVNHFMRGIEVFLDGEKEQELEFQKLVINGG